MKVYNYLKFAFRGSKFCGGCTCRGISGLRRRRVFYYLGGLNDSLLYALGDGPHFYVSEDSDYVHTLLGRSCVGLWFISARLHLRFYSLCIFSCEMIYLIFNFPFVPFLSSIFLHFFPVAIIHCD